MVSSRTSFASACLRWDVSNEGFLTGVEKGLRGTLLVSDDFDLDPASSLRYLNFDGRVLDRTTGEWSDVLPNMLISRSTCWKFVEPAWAGSEYDDNLDSGLRKLRKLQDRNGLAVPTELTEEIKEIFFIHTRTIV